MGWWRRDSDGDDPEGPEEDGWEALDEPAGGWWRRGRRHRGAVPDRGSERPAWPWRGADDADMPDYADSARDPDEEGWDEDWEDEPEPDGWQDPGDGRPGLLARIVMLPVRIVTFPFRVAFWFVLICFLWVLLYTVVNPPVWTHYLAERQRLGQAVHFWQDIDAISPHLVRAVIAAEDARFCEHWGIDLDATRAALEETLEGGRVIGGSTITQQTAKNVFLWHGRSWLRKGLEAGFAVAMEAVWSKRRIVEVYLNVAEFDTGTFGAEAAARGYFGVPAARLTLDQAARLAAILPDPRDRSASSPGDFTRRRAADIADGARTLERDGRAACAFD